MILLIHHIHTVYHSLKLCIRNKVSTLFWPQSRATQRYPPETWIGAKALRLPKSWIFRVCWWNGIVEQWILQMRCKMLEDLWPCSTMISVANNKRLWRHSWYKRQLNVVSLTMSLVKMGRILWWLGHFHNHGIKHCTNSIVFVEEAPHYPQV